MGSPLVIGYIIVLVILLNVLLRMYSCIKATKEHVLEEKRVIREEIEELRSSLSDSGLNVSNETLFDDKE